MIVPLFVSREKSIRAVDEALSENRMILLASQKDLDKEEPTAADLYSVGTAAVIMRMLKLPDGRIRILVQGLARAQIESVDTSGEYLRSRINVMQEILPPERSLEVEALVRNVRASMEKAINLGKNISPEVMAIIANLDDADARRFISFKPRTESEDAQLDIADTTARLRRVNELLSKEIEVLMPSGRSIHKQSRYRPLAA
jgi:ATP-dependent Lon protease